mmetsp:Transcript_105195/g.339314  ORF Transcript_105195/g.339314 Transcript_105195/m.339314 type:complete len:201 (+) Transcript_105195:1970-2572(+)
MAATSASVARSQSRRLPTRYRTQRMPKSLSAFFLAKKSRNSLKSMVPLSSSSSNSHCSTKVSISASVPRCCSKILCRSWTSQSSFPTCPKTSIRRLSQASRCLSVCVLCGPASSALSEADGRRAEAFGVDGADDDSRGRLPLALLAAPGVAGSSSCFSSCIVALRRGLFGSVGCRGRRAECGPSCRGEPRSRLVRSPLEP